SQKLAHLTPLFSGADIQNVVEVAAEKVIEEIMESGVERPIRMTDLLAAVASVKPSTVNWLRTIKNYIKYANQDGLYSDVETYLSSVKKYLK
ncbi:MAG: cell division protein, partial [bacterium]|nr:cell division protein [bacterium]